MTPDIDKKVKELFEQTPEEIGVGYGLVIKGGQYTGEKGFIFYVPKKIPRENLHPDEVLPSQISLAGTLHQTDVIEVGQITLLNCSPNVANNCYDWQSVSPPNRGTIRPIQGGISLSSDHRGVGTLGFLALDTETGSLVGVTNNHVVIGAAFYTGNRLQPTIPLPLVPTDNEVNDNAYNTGEFGGGIPQLKIGEVVRYVPLYSTVVAGVPQVIYNKVDGALISVLPSVASENESWRQYGLVGQTGPMPFATTAEINALVGQIAASSGRTSGVKEGPDCGLLIQSVNYTTAVGPFPLRPSNGSALFQNCITFSRINPACDYPIAPGDSGSALCAIINGTYKIIGLNFAGSISTGVACRIDNVAAELGIEAWIGQTPNYVSAKNILSIPGVSNQKIQICQGEEYWQVGLYNSLVPCSPPAPSNTPSQTPSVTPTPSLTPSPTPTPCACTTYEIITGSNVISIQYTNCNTGVISYLGGGAPGTPYPPNSLIRLCSCAVPQGIGGSITVQNPVSGCTPYNLTISTVTGNVGDVVEVPIILNLNPSIQFQLGAISLWILYNSANLACATPFYTDLNPIFTQNTVFNCGTLDPVFGTGLHVLSFAWYDISAPNWTTGILFKARFTILQPGTHPLIFPPDSAYYEVTDPNAIPYQPMTTQNGAVVVNPTPTPSVTPTSTPITAFISQWTTTSANEVITLPLVTGGSYNFTVNWGDGNTDTVTSSGQGFHVYASAGTYTVTIRGQIVGWSFSQVTASRSKIVSVLEWGPLRVGNYGGNFAGCANLNLSSVTDSLNLTGITNLSYFFAGCSSLTTIQNMNSWNVSSVTNMNSMFFQCSSFNQPLNLWSVCLVQDMNNMFNGCSNFDQDISSWNVPLIPAVPTGFSSFTPVTWTTAEKPNWGVAC